MKSKSIKLNFIMNAILTMSSFIFPLITFPYTSRILLPEGTGKVSLATSVISYFMMVAHLGVPTYGIRACAKVRDDRQKLTQTFQEIFIISLVTCAISYLFFFIALLFVPKFAEEKPLYLIVSSTLLFNTIGVEWLYKALEQYTYITIRSLVFKVIALVGMFLLVHQKEDYVIYGAISVFAASASAVMNFANVHKYINLRPVGNYNFKQHISKILIFFSMSCAITVYTALDTVMLGFIKDDTEVGYYNAAIKIKTILVSVVASLGTVLLPRAAYYVENKLMDDFRKICRKAVHFVYLAAIPLMTYFIMYARESILFLSGNEYIDSIVPMIVLMPTLVIIGISNITGLQMLIPLGYEKTVLFSEIAGAVVDLIANFILIPLLDSTGAAIGTLLAEATVLIWQLVFMKKKQINYLSGISAFKIVLGTLISGLCALVFLFLNLPPVVSLIVSAIVFFGVYIVVLTLLKEEMCREILKTIKGKIKKK